MTKKTKTFPVVKKASSNKDVRSLADRLTEVEQVLPRLVAGINQSLMQVDQRFTDHGERLDALTALCGGIDILDAAIQKNRALVAEQKLQEGLKAGALVQVDKIGEKSTVVGVEKDKDGNVIAPGRVQLSLKGFKEEFRSQLLGQGPGFVLPLPDGRSILVSEVYDFVDPPQTTGYVTEAPATVDSPCTDCATAACGQCQCGDDGGNEKVEATAPEKA